MRRFRVDDDDHSRCFSVCCSHHSHKCFKMPPASTATTCVPNPYKRTAQNAANMGRQSQQRVSNQHKRKHKLCSNNNKKKGRQGDQLTLEGTVAFQSERDCIICKAKKIREYLHSCTIPKRAHHVLCPLNTKTHGLGQLTEQSINSIADNKRYKSLTAPIRPEERFSSVNNTREAAATFFEVRTKTTTTTAAAAAVTMTEAQEDLLSPLGLSVAVGKLVDDKEFRQKHKAKGAPLAMLAFASEVSEKTIRNKDKNAFFQHFNNSLEIVVPACHNDLNPHCHSITGQKLLYVDWERTHGMQVPCPDAACQGMLKSERSNFSKNKTLFPIYGLEGSPLWCIVMVMVCPCCRRSYKSNDADILINIPAHAADAYPVETVYAQSTACHLSRQTTEVFSSLMVTYGNGEMCSKLLFNALNRECLRRLKVYYSVAQEKKDTNATITNYIEKDGEHMRQWPPLGDSIRDMYDTAASSRKNPWLISDHDRHTREMQSVKCDSTFAQDHTFQVTKNYQGKIGAMAAWDATSATGEIASAVLVPTTRTEHFAHAAQQLLKRPHFCPSVKCSDAWPNKKECWTSVIPGIEGRLGLIHYQKRIISTLRKKHVDYNEAVTHLLAAMHEHCSDDYEKLLTSLKNGTLSRAGKKCTSEEISDMKRSSVFRDRYAKYLRKRLHKHETIVQNLDDWFCRFKVTSSDDVNRPAGGRLDPIRMEPLFTADTKPAIENCKEKAQCLSDPLPLDKMYDMILPNPNSSHQLTECLSLRGESKLEAFHDRFAHFANCGMRASLADNLNLAGTARYNLSIRHKRSMVSNSQNPNENPLSKPEYRKKIPAGFDAIVPHFNHSELWYVNNLASAVGCCVPFPFAEVLPEDNGERFFSEYISIVMPSLKGVKSGDHGECLCALCRKSSTKNVIFTTAITTPTKATSTRNTTTNLKTPPPTATAAKNNYNNNVNSQITRKHTSLPHRPPNLIANGAHFHSLGAPIAIAPLIPMQHQMPFWYNCIAPMGPCCAKCAQWLTTRVGRPPHNPLCPNRQQINRCLLALAPPFMPSSWPVQLV